MTLEGPKWLAMGSKRVHFTCLCTPNGLGSFLEKHIFDPFFVPKQPIFKAFWDFRRAKTGHHELKPRRKHLFWHSMQSRIIFEKSLFLHPLDPIDPFWHPPLWATSCRLPQPTGPRYGGLGVSEGNFEGWKPLKVGSCGCIRCARNCVLSHVAQDMVLVWGYRRPMCTNFGAFGGLLGAVRGHIVELEGPRGPFGTGKSSCMCRVATISLLLAVVSKF